jgi:uncharacterized protein
MEKAKIIAAVEDFVKDYLEGKESSHNWWHIYRVRETALHIQSEEGTGDRFIIELAALLHDVGDSKIDSSGDGSKMVSRLLTKLGVNVPDREHVLHILNYISFRDRFDACMERSDELNIVQDADRLDAIGAIGIARAFSYGGSAGKEIYIPGQKPENHRTKSEYQKSDSSTINHFYEKLLLLKEMMNTETGYQIALQRHEFMEDFLKQFYNELSFNS